METLKQRIINIQRDYSGKRSKIEDEAQKTMSEYEARILKTQTEMEERVKNLKDEERKALSLAESKVMNKLISDVLLRSEDFSFEDARGRRWKADKIEWSSGSYIVNDCLSGGNSWFGDTFSEERKEFTPELIQAQLKENDITYHISDPSKYLIVSVNCPKNRMNGYNKAIQCPEMTFHRCNEQDSFKKYWPI